MICILFELKKNSMKKKFRFWTFRHNQQDSDAAVDFVEQGQGGILTVEVQAR